MNNLKVFGIAVAFTGLAGAFIYTGATTIIDNATNVMTKPVAGVDTTTQARPIQTTKVDCSQTMPKFGSTQACAPNEQTKTLGTYQAPTNRP